MNGPRLTEERLRYHLDSNQAMRERLCLAVLPLLGPYTREQPRRPKGGPDGARDIEAVYQGSTLVWGAVGFRNGGGNDDVARREIEKKFYFDLDNALSEKPNLKGFIFFTNVDLTPGIIESLKIKASSKGIDIIDIFDIERLRHVLDSPEGLIARLQYLDISMSPTEQISLVSKFGNQLQKAVLARFDRVEQTLSQMERFLAFQKPLYKLDIFIFLNGQFSSRSMGDEAVLVEIRGLQNIDKSTHCLCLNDISHPFSNEHIVISPYGWIEDEIEKLTTFDPSCSYIGSMMNANFNNFSLTTGGHRIRIFDLSIISFQVFCTPGFASKITQIIVEANGYELFNCPISTSAQARASDLPSKLPFSLKERNWMLASKSIMRNLLIDPPRFLITALCHRK